MRKERLLKIVKNWIPQERRTTRGLPNTWIIRIKMIISERNLTEKTRETVMSSRVAGGRRVYIWIKLWVRWLV